MASSNGGGGVPPGFRFHPTDEELLHYYLKKKVSFHKFDMEVIREVDLNKIEPWELQERCKIGSTPQNEWYFFSHKDRKYPTGSRTNRATNAGFWKATGRDKCIRNTFKKIGMRKTLVFYRGRAPHGQKTDWIMHEYRLEDGDHDPQANPTEDGWVVCRVFKKKNLFKVGNEGGGGSAHVVAVACDHINNNTASTNSAYTQQRENQYLLHHGHQQPHGLNYSHVPVAAMVPNHHHHHQYSHHIQAQSCMQTHKPPLLGVGYHDYSAALSDQSALVVPMVQVKELMTTTTTTKDCESESTDHGNNINASTTLPYNQAACESGLEVGTCDVTSHHHHRSMQVADSGSGRDDQNMISGGDHHQWGRMIDHRMVVNSDHHHQFGGNMGSSSKGLGFEVEPADTTSNIPSSMNQINPLSLRCEMDFWGYGK